MDLDTFSDREVEVDDRGRIGLAIGLGAVIGGAVGYLLFTDRGRNLRDNLEPRLQDLLTEIDQLTRTFDRARSAAVEGWQSFSTLMQQETRNAADTVKRSASDAGAALKDIQSGRTH
jgi:gas vesicle protein